MGYLLSHFASVRAACRPRTIFLPPRFAALAAAAIAAVTLSGAWLAPLPASAVPLAQWQADEDKLLGETPLTRADLPDEWQGLGAAELAELMAGVYATAKKHYAAGEFQRALPAYQQYAYLALNTDQPGEVGKALRGIGSVYWYLGQYEKALTYYEQSLAIAREIGDITGEGNCLIGIGNVYLYTGQYDEALTFYEQSLAIERETGDTKGEGDSLNNIGNIYWYLGQYDKALAYHERSLAIERGIGDIAGEGCSLDNIGMVYADLGQYDKALTYHERSLAIERGIGDIAGEGRSLDFIGFAYANLGQYEQALANYRQSLAIARETRDIRGEGDALSGIGLVYSRVGQYEQVLTYCEQSLAIERALGDITSEEDSLNNIGEAFAALGRFEQALERFQCSFGVASSQATQFTWESGLKGGLVEDVSYAGSALAQVQMGLGQEVEAFATVQAAKGLPLLQLLAQAQVQSPDAQIQAALERYRNANAARQVYEKQLCGLAEDDAEGRAYAQGQIDQYQAQARDAWEYIKQHEPRLTEIIEVKGLTADEVQQQVLKPGQVVLEYLLVTPENQLPEPQQAAASSGEQGAEGANAAAPAGEAQRRGEIIIFCLPWQGGLTVARTPLPELPEGLDFAGWLKQKLARLILDADAPEPVVKEAARQLYELLLAPVASSIPAAAPGGQPVELIICPDGLLYSVPFEALLDGAGKYVLERYPVRYSTSATLLSYLKPAGGASGALVAGVSFAADGEGKAPGAAQRGADLARGALFQGQGFYPLPGVVLEARAVAKLLRAEPLLEEQATEQALREYMPGHAVIHLATHGFLHEVPLFNGVVAYLPPAAGGAAGAGQMRELLINPAGDEVLPREIVLHPEGDEVLPREIVLHPEGDEVLPRGGVGSSLGAGTVEDGFLTMAEVMGLDLAGCELVVLSCCHSAEGDVAPGAGVMGLAQGFTYAGARGVLASLAKVDDAAALKLMQQFYREWRNGGASKAEALRRAKLALLRSRRYRAPRAWAPFVLYGAE